jgi:hypothetical protein
VKLPALEPPSPDSGHPRGFHPPCPAFHRQALAEPGCRGQGTGRHDREPCHTRRATAAGRLGDRTRHSRRNLIVAVDNPERIRSEAAFAKLAGIRPIPPAPESLPAGAASTAAGTRNSTQPSTAQLSKDEIPRTHLLLTSPAEPPKGNLNATHPRGLPPAPTPNRRPAKSRVDNYRSINAKQESFGFMVRAEFRTRRTGAARRRAHLLQAKERTGTLPSFGPAFSPGCKGWRTR